MAGRERRSNAGAKMAKLLDNEEEDDFYKSTYGGFNEVCVVPVIVRSNIEISIQVDYLFIPHFI